MSKTHIRGLNLAELTAALKAAGQPAFRAGQIFSWLYHKDCVSFERMSNLPPALRSFLEEHYRIETLSLVRRAVSVDATEKFLFATADGQHLESVSIPAEGRTTACISSQVGCTFGCAFCLSGTGGFKRDLTSGEILDQVCAVKRLNQRRELTHIVFMGMGEPLDNYDQVLKAVRMINVKEALGIGARRITISTCGIIPGIERLEKEGLQIELSVSLHAAFDSLRTRLMPVNKVYPLKKLIASCRHYAEQTKRQVTFEYIMLKGVNSSLSDARELGTILKGMEAKVNLIAVNPGSRMGFQPPNKMELLSFKTAVAKQGVPVTVRQSRGQDIEAACGQLRMLHEKN